MGKSVLQETMCSVRILTRHTLNGLHQYFSILLYVDCSQIAYWTMISGACSLLKTTRKLYGKEQTSTGQNLQWMQILKESNSMGTSIFGASRGRG